MAASEAGTHQVVEGGALLAVTHVCEEAMVGHQQQRTRVLQVIVKLTLSPGLRL